jgi:LmbE family N-acetylglucosaminyl deacetylase
VISAGQLHRIWRALPIGSAEEIIGEMTGLILAPHPDDESLGCGGLIGTCCAAGRPPLVVILTDGSASHPGSRRYPGAELATLREAEATEAVRILGLPAERLLFLREPDGRAPHAGPGFDLIVHRLVDYVRMYNCSTILAPWCGDPHCDHEAAARIAGETARVCGIRQLAYPVWGWAFPADAEVEETARAWRLDITPHLEAKRRAIAAHASQHGRLITDDPADSGCRRNCFACSKLTGRPSCCHEWKTSVARCKAFPTPL